MGLLYNLAASEGEGQVNLMKRVSGRMVGDSRRGRVGWCEWILMEVIRLSRAAHP